MSIFGLFNQKKKKKLIRLDVIKLKAGCICYTRVGEKIRILCTDRKDSHYPIVGLMEKDEMEHVVYYNKYGGFHMDNSDQSKHDLIQIEEVE